MYVSYASGAQITHVSHAFFICFACVKCLGYVYVALVSLLKTEAMKPSGIQLIGVVFFGVVAMVAVVTSPQLLDV